MRRERAADQPGRRRWGSASRRLCLGTDPLVFRSPGASSGDEAVGLVHVASGDPREPHRRPGRWGSPGRLTRFGNQVCAAGYLGDETFSIRLNKHVGRARTQCRCFLTLDLDLKGVPLTPVERLDVGVILLARRAHIAVCRHTRTEFNPVFRGKY